MYVPPGATIVGEGLAAVIMAAGDKFSNSSNPHPVVQIGRPEESGVVEMSDLIISTQSAAAGAIWIGYNLKTPCFGGTTASGLWDAHTRVGGFARSELQVADCPIAPDLPNVIEPCCMVAYMSVHITPSARGLYMENNWLWVADHDIEDWNATRIDVLAGRGLLIEGTRIWLVGTSVEHHVLYQHQLVSVPDVWMGQVRGKFPYYQPNPPAPYPFTEMNTTLHDPYFLTEYLAAPNNNKLAANVTRIAQLPRNPPCAMA